MSLYYNTTMFKRTPKDKKARIMEEKDVLGEEYLEDPLEELSDPKKSSGSFFGDLFRFTIISVIIVVPIRLFIASPFIVNGASMDPTFHTGEYLVIDQISYRLSEPERGDVVIFHYPKDPSKFFIKRVIGLPGETVSFEGNDIRIINDSHPEGFILNQSFLENSSVNTIETFELRDDEYIVLGDNRNASSDSRAWGAVTRKLIVGRAFLRLFPLNTMSVLPGDIPSEAFQR